MAGALLYPIALRRSARSGGRSEGRARLGAKAWFAGGVVGILLLSAGNGGLTFAERTLPSGFAAVLVATVPLWMIVFAWPVQHQRVSWRSATGLAIGLVGVAVCAGVSQVLSSMLFGLSARDPIAFVCVPLFLLAVALIASYIPARRAMRVDPMVALRCE